MLEQITYQLPRISEARQQVYQVGDLESLSASALYYGNGGSGFGGGGFWGIGKGDIAKFGIVRTPLMKIEPVMRGMTLPGGLTIKDLTKNSAVFQEDFGGVGNIYVAHPDGSGSTRFYGFGEGEKKVTKENWMITLQKKHGIVP
ncbi:MAG: hypothetical protein AABW93_01320 [Nanoarchaeota archaeon]